MKRQSAVSSDIYETGFITRIYDISLKKKVPIHRCILDSTERSDQHFFRADCTMGFDRL